MLPRRNKTFLEPYLLCITLALFRSIIEKGIPMFVSVCEEKPCFYLELDPELQSALLHKSDISQLSSENFNKTIDINRSIHT